MNRIMLLLGLFLWSQYAQAQYVSGQITYREKAVENLVDTAKIEGSRLKKLNLLNHFRNIANQVRFLDYTLKFNENESRFTSPTYMTNDNGANLELAKAASAAQGVFYVNLNQRMRTHQFSVRGKTWLVMKSLDSLNWKIRDGHRFIAGYKCYKATAKIKLNRLVEGEVVAWFTPDIPFQYGPLGFAGLPGMILGLKRHHFYFYAERVKLSREKQEIKKPERGKRISQNRYFQLFTP